jgi:hypothetical protein
VFHVVSVEAKRGEEMMGFLLRITRDAGQQAKGWACEHVLLDGFGGWAHEEAGVVGGYGFGL